MITVTCPGCGTDMEVADEIAGGVVACPACDATLATPPIVAPSAAAPPPLPLHYQYEEPLVLLARQGFLTRKTLAATDPKKVKDALHRIVMTTETMITSHAITERLGIVTYEAAVGMGFFKDIATSFSDFFGGRSKTTQNALREVRNAVLRGLKEEALLMGADAVVAVDLDYSEFSGQGKSMLFLVGSGTAVRWKAAE